MKSAVQDDIRAIPSKGHDGPSLRDAMVKQTKVRIRASGATALVRLEVAGPGTLPAYMEGIKSRWLHPVWDSSRHRWTKTPQAPHPYFRRAVIPHLVDVRAGVEAAVAETAASIRI